MGRANSYRYCGTGLVAFACLLTQPVLARDKPAAGAAPVRSAPAMATSAVTPVPVACPVGEGGAPAPCVPPLTPVKLVIRTHLGSKISTSGEMFEIELDQPILVDGKVAIPAGTRGVGEVVHAKKNGGSGASGELVLAARYLDVGGRRLRLRSLNFAVSAPDRVGTVNTMAVASPALALIGFFVKGKGIDLPEGTMADAKTAEPFVVDPPAAASPPAAPAAPEPVQPPPQ